METNLVDITFEPEENECMTVNELLDLDNDILCSVAEANEQFTHILLLILLCLQRKLHIWRREPMKP